MGEDLLGELLLIEPGPRLDDPVGTADGDEGNTGGAAEFLDIPVVAGAVEVVDVEIDWSVGVVR